MYLGMDRVGANGPLLSSPFLSKIDSRPPSPPRVLVHTTDLFNALRFYRRIRKISRKLQAYYYFFTSL